MNIDPGILFGLALGLVAGVGTVRYARRRLREAEALQARGWICVGINFITGPVMVPPPPDFLDRR
jgi:hypothetical protein